MPTLNPLTNDNLHKIHRRENEVVKRYRQQLKDIIRLSKSAESESVRVQAHRTLLEFIINPLKERLLEERKAKLLITQQNLPTSINLAISGLPVGQSADVSVRVSGDTSHNAYSQKSTSPLESAQCNSYANAVVDVTSQVVSSEDGAGRATGEAAARQLPGSTSADVPKDFSPNLKPSKPKTKYMEVVELRRSVRGQPRVCLTCGRDISEKHHKAIYCSTCQKAKRNEHTRNYMAERKRRIEELKKEGGHT